MKKNKNNKRTELIKMYFIITACKIGKCKKVPHITPTDLFKS